MSREIALNVPIEHPIGDKLYRFRRLPEYDLGGLMAWAKGRLKLLQREILTGRDYLEWIHYVEALPYNDNAILNQLMSPEGVVHTVWLSVKAEHPEVSEDDVTGWFWEHPDELGTVATQVIPQGGGEDDGDTKAAAATSGEPSA